jgi:hypothetical protein
LRDSGILVGGEKEEEKVKAEKIRRAVASSQVTATFGSDREHYQPFSFLLSALRSRRCTETNETSGHRALF